MHDPGRSSMSASTWWGSILGWSVCSSMGTCPICQVLTRASGRTVIAVVLAMRDDQYRLRRGNPRGYGAVFSHQRLRRAHQRAAGQEKCPVRAPASRWQQSGFLAHVKVSSTVAARWIGTGQDLGLGKFGTCMGLEQSTNGSSSEQKMALRHGAARCGLWSEQLAVGAHGVVCASISHLGGVAVVHHVLRLRTPRMLRTALKAACAGQSARQCLPFSPLATQR